MDIKKHLNNIKGRVDNIVVLNGEFIYIKISKTVGSLLHRELFDKVYSNTKVKLYFNYKDHRNRFNNWLENENDFSKYFIFTFVRNTF